MRVDTSRSRYVESSSVEKDFKRDEIRHAKTLLRRLQFLEAQIAETGGGGYPEWEAAALEWVLDDIGFIDIREVSRNTPTRKRASS